MHEHASKPLTAPASKKKDAQSPVFEHLVHAQPRLFAYALTLVTDLDIAHEVLQQTNCKLLENADRFQTDQDFMPWACGAIRNEVLAYYRDRSRDKHVFSVSFISTMAEVAQREMKDDGQRSALKVCYEKLTDHQRMLIDMRYGPQGTVARMAEQLGRPASSISASLNKIRRLLEDCILRVLGATEQ